MVLSRSRSRWLVVVGSVIGAACSASSEPGNERAPKPATATLPEDGPPSTPALDASPLDAIAIDGAHAHADAAPDAPPRHATVSECFQDIAGPIPAANYDQFSPKMSSHCAGTQHQKIAGVERVVFVGDSITAGTPPTPSNKYYRQLVADGVRQRFGSNVSVGDCSKWGGRIGDLLTAPGSNQPGEIEQCFPKGVETAKTLVVMTVGANDVSAWAKDQLTAQAATTEADVAAAKLGAALAWLKSPAHFPNGSWVVFANTYEYTDSSGDLLSCPAAGLSGFKSNWSQGTPAVLRFQELFMQQAVATGSDLVFLLENFCGHGYRRADPNLQCYRGPNTELWFDLTCYHPNEKGHAKIAEYVLRVIDG